MGIFGRKEPAQDMPLACPRDGRAMLKVTTPEKVVIDRCPGCSGLWFDHAELKRVSHDDEVEQLAQRVRAYSEPSGFACPRCAAACVRSHVGEVEVDTCTMCHGVWLDAGELEESKRQLDTERLLSGGGPGLRSFLVRL